MDNDGSVNTAASPAAGRQVLVHNAGTSDMAWAGDGEALTEPGRKGTASAVVQPEHRSLLAAELAKVGPVCKEHGCAIDLDGYSMASPRLESYIRNVADVADDDPPHAPGLTIILNLSVQGKPPDPIAGDNPALHSAVEWVERCSKDDRTDSRWMAPFLVRWLELCCAVRPGDVRIDFYNVGYYFTTIGAAPYGLLRSRLAHHRREIGAEASWSVTLTGGLPEMRMDLALAAGAELAAPRLLAVVFMGGQPSRTHVHESQVISLLQLTEITRLVHDWHYAAAARLLAIHMPEQKAMMHLLNSGAARLDLRLTAARSSAASAKKEGAGIDPDSYLPESLQTLARQLADGSRSQDLIPVTPMLSEQVRSVEALLRQERFRDALVQLEVYLCWLAAERARVAGLICSRALTFRGSHVGQLTAALATVAGRPAQQLATDIRQGRFVGGYPSVGQWRQIVYGLAGGIESEPLAAFDCLAQLCRDCRVAGAHHLAGPGLGTIRDALSLGARATPRTIIGAVLSKMRLCHTLATDEPLVLLNDPGSPFVMLNDAWDSLARQALNAAVRSKP